MGMFGLPLHNVPRMDSFASAERFFNEAKYRTRDPDVVYLTRKGDMSKTVIRSFSDHGAEHCTHYAIKYHSTEIITYSKGVHGEFLHIDTGHESMADRGLIHRMTPFSVGTFRGRTVVQVNDGSYIFSTANFKRVEKGWEITDMGDEPVFMQLEVVKRLSRQSRALLTDIENYHKITQRPKHGPGGGHIDPRTMLGIAMAAIGTPSTWVATAKFLTPSQMPLLKACLLIAEGGVVKRPVPSGQLPTKCVYDRFTDIVPLVETN